MNWRYFTHGGKDYRVGKDRVVQQAMFYWRARLEIRVDRNFVLLGFGKWDGDLITDMRRISVDGDQAGKSIPQPLTDAANAALHHSPPKALTIDLVIGTQTRLDDLKALLTALGMRNRSDYIRRLIDKEIERARKKGLIPGGVRAA